MNIPIVNLTIQHKKLRKEINRAIQGVLDRADFILGQDVAKFEEEFAAYCGTKCAVGVDSGLSALELSLRAFEIGPGDEVIVPAHTNIATAAAVTFAGATPLFVDVDSQTMNMDVEKVEYAITSHTKAILPVHIYGLPADMKPILDIAERYKLVVIEDACQAHGATYRGRRTGGLGHAAGFSFYPTKTSVHAAMQAWSQQMMKMLPKRSVYCAIAAKGSRTFMNSHPSTVASITCKLRSCGSSCTILMNGSAHAAVWPCCITSFCQIPM